jgi:SAM-dependent methyltransferase
MYLTNPETKNKFAYNWYEKNNDDNYETFDNIPDFFINDTSSLTEIQSNFYNEVKFPNYDNIDNFGTLIEKASRSIFAKKLDEEIPFGSKILEAGCGTGQLSIFLSRFGRKVYAIDISRGSLLEAKKFIDKCEIKNVYLSRMNIFKSFFPKNYFDFVISNGVLHHTHSAKLAFQNITKLLKPGGYIFIGLYHKQGRFLHSIRQKIIGTFGTKFDFLDSFFKRNTSEEKKKAWFLDQYKNPSETSHSASELLSWFEESDIDYISSVPFDFDPNVNLLKKRNKPFKYSLMIKEKIELFKLENLKEGGFFIMIGKKRQF